MRAVREILCAACCGCAIVPAAHAQTTAYAPDTGRTPNQIVLSVPVTASIGGRCGFADGGAPDGSFHQDNFDETGLQHDFAFVLNCTGPSRVAVVSQNGGLLTPGTAPAGYTTKAPYNVTLHLVGDGGATTATASCAAETLPAGSSCSFIGPASVSQGLRLASPSTLQAGSYLNVSAPPYSGAATLVNGAYSDVLTVTLSASP